MAVASTAAPARRFRPRSFGRCPGAGGGGQRAGRRPAAPRSPRAGGGAASPAARRRRRRREVRSPVGPASPGYSPALSFPFFLFLSQLPPPAAAAAAASSRPLPEIRRQPPRPRRSSPRQRRHPNSTPQYYHHRPPRLAAARGRGQSSRTLLPFQACVGEGCCAPVSVRLGGSSPWLIKVYQWVTISGHDCVCQRTKKGLSETITEAPTFNTALKEHSFTGSKERQTPKVYRQFSSSSTTITDLELTRKFPYGIHNDYSNNSSYITIELQITYISIVRMLILQLFKKLRYAARRQIYHQ
ncbi:uncharacterized protein LOC112661034 [Canis lupus dingo]|uniref:uncharacterized protein LOC112661034 n=1 Tax=Canis lupus dingo TaxID=286419 RepID=UPI0020C35906|nr:uncharacterized protein LOC112661034 [Canis lupus dingo]